MIRSKGVGVYFVTQNPTDIPDGVLGQLDNRIQHAALRAYTARDQKAVRAAAETKVRQVAKDEKARMAKQKMSSKTRSSSRRSDSAIDAFVKSAIRSLAGQAGRKLIRGILGSLFGGK